MPKGVKGLTSITREVYEDAGWEYKLWRGSAFNVLSETHRMNAYRHISWLSDVVRVEILKRHGGVYMDVDCIALRPISDGMLDNDYFTGNTLIENRTHPEHCVIGSHPDGRMINILSKRLNKKGAADTFNIIVDSVRENKGHPGVKIYPFYYFSPHNKFENS